MTTDQTTISLQDVTRKIMEAYRDSLDHGGGRWFYVRVWPSGKITAGMEVSPCYPESEYYRRGTPHPISVWSKQSNSDMTDAEIEEEMDSIDDNWLDPIRQDAREALEQAGYTVTD